MIDEMSVLTEQSQKPDFWEEVFYEFFTGRSSLTRTKSLSQLLCLKWGLKIALCQKNKVWVWGFCSQVIW